MLLTVSSFLVGRGRRPKRRRKGISRDGSPSSQARSAAISPFPLTDTSTLGKAVALAILGHSYKPPVQKLNQCTHTYTPGEDACSVYSGDDEEKVCVYSGDENTAW